MNTSSTTPPTPRTISDSALRAGAQTITWRPSRSHTGHVVAVAFDSAAAANPWARAWAIRLHQTIIGRRDATTASWVVSIPTDMTGVSCTHPLTWSAADWAATATAPIPLLDGIAHCIVCNEIFVSHDEVDTCPYCDTRQYTR